MPYMWYCMRVITHGIIGIRHFHSDHYWLSMPIVQSTLTGMHYHYHNWHCAQCLFCGIACQKPHIAQLAFSIFTQTTIDCQCQLCNLRFLACITIITIGIVHNAFCVVWYCLPETAHRTIGIFHFHSTHYWLAMPIVQSTVTGMHYHYHDWHCFTQCQFRTFPCFAIEN